MKLFSDYKENIEYMREALGVSRSFDIVERRLSLDSSECSFFFIDGFVKDGVMQRIMTELSGLGGLLTAERVCSSLPALEISYAYDFEVVIRSVLSGECVMLGSEFGAHSILIDARTYPMRNTAEPDSDRVMQGARDGFVETLVTNTALIRRRIRDRRLVTEHFTVGTSSATDVVAVYLDGVASEKMLEDLRKKLKKIKPKALPLGYQSLAETLIPDGWLNPFPKIRTTERPDTAAAEILEGYVVLLVDTSPQAMILPTSIFDYLDETDDYYLPPLTGSYLRIVRTAILILSMFITPLWYFVLESETVLPPSLAFLIPDETGALPILLQLLLVEVVIDGLKIASMNTPDMLSNSLSVIGALILGDFAVSVGWVCEDVVLYMAFVALANFAQQNAELGYAIKFVRILSLIFVFGFGGWGLLLGGALFLFLVFTNRSVTGRYHYLYPLIPFDFEALKRLIFRLKKTDAEDSIDA